MRKILLFLLVILSFQAFGQTPPGYQTRIVRERIQGSFMVDSALHIPRYNGTPVGVRVGSSVQDGAIAMDTLNHLFYYYSGGTWRIISGDNIYNTNGILAGNRTLTGLNNTYSLHLDSLSGFRAGRNGVNRFYFDGTTSSMISQNTNAAVTVNTSQAIMNYQANALRVAVDSSTITKILSYETNINGSLTPNAHATKSYVDSVAAASAPTLQTVTNAGQETTDYIGVEELRIWPTFSGSRYTSNWVGNLGYSGNGVSAYGNLTFRENSTGGGNTVTLSPVNSIPSSFEIFLPPGNSGDTLATLADVRAGGGGGGVTSVGSGFGTNFSTITSTGTVVVDSTSGGVTSWVRTKKIIDSLQAAGWGDQSVNSIPRYQYYMDVSASTQANFYPSGAGTLAASTIPVTGIADGWISGREQTTGNTNAGRAFIYYGYSGGYTPITISNSYRYNYGAKVRLEDLSDGTETYEVYSGFGDEANIFSSVVDGVGFRYTHADSSGNWIMWTKSNSTLTEDATTTTVAADTDYELEVSIFGGVAYYYINKVLAGTISSNIPTGTSRITSTNTVIRKTNGTTARKMYVEWCALGKQNF